MNAQTHAVQLVGALLVMSLDQIWIRIDTSALWKVKKDERITLLFTIINKLGVPLHCIATEAKDYNKAI